MAKGITLNLTGPREGLPTVDDLVKLLKALTGREPTQEEIDRATKRYEATLGSSGDEATLGSSGDEVTLGSSGAK